MELRALRYFLAAARERSMSRAAETAHVTQPALSRQIMDLERELGAELFIRNRQNRPLVLTEAGRMLRMRAEDIVGMVDKTALDMRSLLEEEAAGEIAVGCAESARMSFFADALFELRRRYPRIRCNLYSGDSEGVIGQLDAGLFDFAVITHNVDLEKYNCLTFPQKDRWGVALRADSPLAAKAAITLDDLLDEPLICSRQALRADLPKWFGDALDRLNVVATMNLAFNAAMLARRGVGHLLLFEGLVDTGPASGLRFRPLSPELTTELHLIWRKGRRFATPARLLLDELRRVFGENAAG